MQRHRNDLKKAGFLLVSLFAIPVSLRAQSPKQLLVRAESLYNAASIEAARQLFAQITTYKGVVALQDRVDAYKYLGASYAVLSQRDSAVSYFVAALDNDPFTTLDAATFGGDEQAAFALAKKQIFKAGIAEITEQALDPQSSKSDSSTYTFRFVTTHIAKVTVDLAKRGDSSKHEVLFNANNDGSRDVAWHGLLLAQRVDSGIYELRVTATDALPAAAASAALTKETPSVLFRISEAYEPLEDTLPALGQADTLVSQIGRMAPVWDFMKGLSVASVAMALPLVATRSDLPQWGTQAGVGIGIGLTSGTIAAIIGSKNPTDKTAAAENARRRRQHDAFNAGVRARNAARRARTILVIRPLTGSGG